MGAVDRLLHRNQAAQPVSDVATTGTAGPASGMMGMIYRPRMRRLEDRLLLDAVPEAAVVDLPDDQFINEDFQFTVSFDNTSPTPADVGYGPFVDVTVGPGIEVNNVTYLGASLQSQEVGTWDGSQWVDGSGNPVTQHPLDTVGGQLAMPVGSIEGETWINVLAPFGSYTPDQPAIDLVFSATMEESPDADPVTGAVPGTDIIVTASGGFRFGEDPLDNPTEDAPIQQGAAQSDTVTPIVMRLEKDVQLAEDETAQGPNFPFTYTISVDIADGVTVTDINIQDLLPTNLFFLNATTNVGADAVLAPGVGGTAQGVPGIDTITTAQWTFASVTGQTGEGDIVITLTAYAPEFAADGTDLNQMDEDNPTSYLATNNAEVESANYIAANGDTVAIDPTNSGQLEDSIDIIIRPYTVLKTASIEGGGDAVPGAYVQYEIDIDVSDYLALQDGVLTDVLADGLTLDTTDNLTLDHTPVLRVEMNGEVFLFDLTTTPPPGGETELTATFQGDGTQQVTFFLSAAVRNGGAADDTLFGDLFNGNGQEGPTRMTLTYYALINENYRVKGGGAPVVVNDTLANSVNLTLNSQTSGNAAQPDGSGDQVVIDPPLSTKSLYAVNGEIGAPAQIAPGDVVTYRIRIEVGSADVDDLVITDYLPSPIYNVDEQGTFTFVDGGPAIPAAYTVTLGPDDTLSGTAVVANPTVSVDGASNSIIITYGDFNEEASQGGVIDLLYTITVLDEPFADGLLLTNQAVIQTANTDVVIDEDVIINDVVFHQPELSLTKGVVATDANGAVDDSLGFDPTATAPDKMTFTLGEDGFTTTSPVTADDLAAAPIDSDMSGFDAGDTVKFAVTVQNSGGEDAFDVVLNDTLPPGFEIPPGAVLTVQYGDGTAVSFSGTIEDFFSSTGITLNDDDVNGIGAIAAAGDANGHDIVIISYELVAVDDVNPGVTVTNTAEIVSFAALEGGTDFTEALTGQFTDDAEVTAQGVAVEKRLIATDQDFTSGNDLTIGETGTFQIEVTMPDGETPATVTDVLPQGMVLVEGTVFLRLTFTNANGDTVTFNGTVAQAGSALADGAPITFTQAGNTLTFDFSNIVTNAAPGTDLSGQTFVIEYQAMASDDPALAAGVAATNTATLDTPTTDPVSDTAAVDIVEPDLTVTKTFEPNVAEAGQTVDMTISVQNGSGTFTTTSFGLNLTDLDVDLSEAVFSNISFVSMSGTGGVVAQIPDDVTVDVDLVNGQWQITVTATDDFAMAPGERLNLLFSVTIAPDVETGTVVENTATIVDDGYSSLPGDDPDERLFGPEEGTDTLTIATPTITKTIINTSYGGTEQLSPDDPDYLADPDTDVLVGEIVTYQLNVRIPRGVSNDVIVYDDTNFVTATGTVGIMEIVGVDSIVVGGSIVQVTDETVQLLDTDGDGIAERLQINFGSLTNDALGDVDVDAESIVIVFRAQILDVTETNDGDIHTNGTAVTFTVGGEPNFNVADTFPTVTVHEPNIDVVKTATTPDSTTDAGDVVTYTLTLSHTAASSADGFSLDLTDVLDDDMILIAGSASIDAGAPAQGLDPLELGDVTLDTVNNQVLVSGFDLGLNQTVTITYQARVNTDVVSGQQLTNNVSLTYQSLPALDPVDNVDPSVAEPGDIVPVVNQGDPGDSETRSYVDDATATVIIAQPGPITKTTDKTSYTIGEQILYTVRVPVIEGQTVNPVLVDILPAGQDFIEGTGSIVAADGTVLTGTFAQDGQSLILDGDTFTTAADNNPDNDFILITFTTQVQNLDVNNNGETKTNTVTFTSDGQPDRTANANITIVEPDIVMTKSNDAPGPVDAGDVVTYTVTATHASGSTSDAFEFSFTDNLPANMGAVAIVSATVNGVDVSDQLVFDQDTGVLTGTDIDIPLGASLVVVYQVVVLDAAGPNQTITNTASGNWSSLDGDQDPGATDGERDGSETPVVNDYVTSADAQIVTDNNIELTKTASVEQATIGETVTYTLDVTVFEGTLQNVVVQDFTQAGLDIDLASLQIVDSGFAGAAGLVIVNPTLVPSTTVPGGFLLTFQLQNSADGSLVNPGDVIGDTTPNDTIRITYTAVVVNELINQDGEQIDNAASVQADNTPRATGADAIAIVEPVITIDKTVVSPAGPVDAGDIIDYQVVLTNTGTLTAFDVTFFDLAPPNTIFTGIVTAVDSSGTPIGTFTIAADGSRIDGAGFDIAVGASVTLTYSVTVVETVEPGDTITNLATVRWTSTSGTNPDERTGEDGHPDGNFEDDGPDDADDTLNNYEATDTTTVVTEFEIDVTKQLIGSSLDDTTGSQLTIGETGTFAIDVSLTEGTTPGVVVVDQLPDGFVYTPGSLVVDAPEGTLFDGQTTLDPSAIVYDPATDTLTINLGTVTTPASNDTTAGAPDLRVIRLQYSGVVSNQLSNQDTVALANSVTVTTTALGVGPDTAGPVEITVVEPEIAVDKTVVTDPAEIQDAGDVVTYQVVLSNTGTSTAFDVTFTDTAPANTTFTGDVVDENGVVIGGFTVTDGLITGTIDQIAVGQTVTLVYSLVIDETVSPGDTLTNAVDVRWTSTPGDNDDERTGVDGHTDDSFDDDGPGDIDDTLNNYQAEDAETVVLGDFPIAIEKTLLESNVDETAGNQLTIGETGTYALDVTVPEGTLHNLMVVDIVGPGLDVDETSVAIDMLNFNGAAITVVSATKTIDANGVTTLTIILDNSAALGNQIVNPGDPTGDPTDNDMFRITYNAVVINELGNQAGVAIVNNATASADDVAPVSDDETISLVEPNVTIDKTVTSPSGPVDAGDVITYQVVLTNNGNSVAFDVDFTDLAPANGLFTGTVTAVDQNGAPVGSFTISAGGTVISGDPFDIAVGGTVTITYSLTVQNTVTNADSLVNQANVTWTSTPGTNADERDGDDGPGPDALVLDNYAASDSATVVTDFTISIEKTLTSSSVAETTGNQLTIGETGTYALDITVSEGTINNLVVVDVTDAWMRIDLSSLTVEDIGFAGGTVTIVNATLTVNAFGVATLSFQLDNTPGTPEIQLVNPGDPFGDTTSNDTIRVTYSATVLNNILNQDGDVISNAATVSAGDGIASVTDDETISLVEPDLVIDKIAVPIVTVGGTAFYQIRVDHTANSHVDAFDVVVSDPFNNPLLTLNQGSVTATVENGTGTAEVTFVGTGFVVTLDRLELGATLVINFTAQSVVTTGADGATIPNTSTIGYDSIPDTQTPDEQRDYSGEDTAFVTVTGPDLVLTKDASVDVIEPGDLFTYDIQVQNLGAPDIDIPLVETARNVVFTDILPIDVELLSVSVDGVDTPFTFDPTTRVVTVALANIPPDVTRIITLFMQASDTFSPATSGGTGDVELINVAEVDMSQTDPTPENNIDDATVTTRGISDLVVTKTNAVEEIGGSETVPFTITAQNVGDRVAADVQIIDRVDTTVFEFVSASDGGVFDPVSGTVTWRLDTLSPEDGVRVFTMVLKVRPGLSPSVDDTTDVVTIDDNGQGGRDPTPENNIDTHTDRLIYPDLVITKANGVDEVSPGDIVDYVITVQNVGEFRADGVVVRDVIDTRVFRFVSATNGGVFDPATGVVTWRLGTVNPGDPPIVLGLTLEVLFPTSTDIDEAVNLVEVNGDGTRGRDANPDNNIASDSDILNAAPDPFEIERVLGDDEEEEEEEPEEPLYIAPLFTGRSAIGSMVRITLIGPDGAPIDTGTTIASPDGNWMLTMNDVDGPPPVSAIVTTSPPTVTALGALDRTNVFFNPGVSTPIDFHRSFDVYSAMDSGSAIVLRDQMEAMEDPLAVRSRRYINFNAVGGTAISDY